MSAKTTRVICNSQDPESRPPVQLSPLAIEDLTGIPAFALTPIGRAEILLEQKITLTSHLEDLLVKYTEARIVREQARGAALTIAMSNEENAAVNLAYAIELAVNKGR